MNDETFSEYCPLKPCVTTLMDVAPDLLSASTANAVPLTETTAVGV